MFLIMLVKCIAGVFAFPCTAILLTNSAVSPRVLGTLNGVVTSVSALGKASGPAIGGAMFEVGAVKGWAILPWWTLAGFAILGAIPVWWLVEREGLGGSRADGGNGDGAEVPEVPISEEGDSPKPTVNGLPEGVPGDWDDTDDRVPDKGSLSTGKGSKSVRAESRRPMDHWGAC